MCCCVDRSCCSLLQPCSLSLLCAAYFGEFGAFEVLQIAFFPIGIFLTLSGVYILSSRDMKKNAARTGGNGELSEVAVSSVDNEIPLSERASGLRPSDAIHLEGDSAANHLDEPSRNRRDDDVRPFAAGLTSSDDPEEVEVMSGGASQKYVTPSSGAQPISPNRRPPPPPDREYPVSASMPAQMFMHTHNANGAYNGSSGQYPAPPLPPGSSRPSTAGEKRMSRFAQRQSRAASRAAEPGQSGGMFASAVAAHAEWRANGSASGQWPAAGSSGQFPARNRTRSTWSAADHSRGSVFHAGLAVLGATGPPDEL
jgi:hypothetical protein